MDPHNYSSKKYEQLKIESTFFIYIRKFCTHNPSTYIYVYIPITRLDL